MVTPMSVKKGRLPTNTYAMGYQPVISVSKRAT
jgi:hypothetical protein